jgi:acetyl-CoA carboxylase alpha subunit
MCALLAKDYDAAIRIAQDLAIRNPDLTAYQILVAQILAEKPGTEDEALERIKNIRRFYKITSDDETLLAASEQMAKERKLSSL